MDFLLPEELVDFSESLGKFFTDAVPATMLRSVLIENEARPVTPEQETLWSSVSELGALLAPIPEEHDGLGFGTLASNVVLHFAGKSLAPVPVFESIALGLTPLIELGSETAKEELLVSIGSGELKVSGALQELFSDSEFASASADDDAFKLNGTLSLASAPNWVDSLVVPANIDGGLQLFLVETKDCELRYQNTLDVVRPYFEVKLSDTPARALTDGPIPSDKLERVKQLVSVLAASEMIGACERSVEMTIEHCSTRKQFGKPIGSFQAVSHKISDMHADTEAAKSLIRFAAYSAENDPEQLPTASAAAKALASDLGPKIVQRAIQAHGGIGFTYEYDLHLFLRRVSCLSALFGSSNHLYSELGAAALS